MEPLSNALSALADALERLDIPYLIGGSVASSIRGIARATRDVGLLAHVAPDQVDALCRDLGRDWYADPVYIRGTLAHGWSFNLIYLPGIHKIDIFPAVEEFHFSGLARASKVPLVFLGDLREYPVASPEDVILAKLRWYRDGGQVSERQLQDVAGIVETNPSLERAYLETWAERLGVTPLLKKALAAGQAT